MHAERPHILSVSYDSTLLRTRQAILEASGYRATSAAAFEEAIAACRASGYDLLVLGHSVPAADKLALIEAFRQHCRSPILALLRPGESELKEASRSLDASYQPQAFLAVVAELLIPETHSETR